MKWTTVYLPIRLWSNHFTNTCLSQLSDIILNGAEKGNHMGMILLDLQKAFDTLDHTVLSEKINGMDSFSDKAINWLSHR